MTKKNTPDKKKVAIALQGGGAHGSFAWGVLDALLEDGRFDILGLSGTSAGAMNCLATAQGMHEGGTEGARAKLREYWKAIGDHAKTSLLHPSPLDQLLGRFSLANAPAFQAMDALTGAFSPYQLNPLNINPLKDIVEQVFDFDIIRNSTRPQVFLCATHVATGKLKIFKNQELSSEAVLASACLPTLFQAVEVNGEFYWDGGFIGNPAIFPLIDHCDTNDIMVIQLRQEHRPKLPTTSREIADRLKEITFNGSLYREMRAISFITKLIDKGIIPEGKMKRLNMHLIRNETEFLKHDMTSALNSTSAFAEHLFESGYDTGRTWIKENFEGIGHHSTFDIEKNFVTEEK